MSEQLAASGVLEKLRTSQKVMYGMGNMGGNFLNFVFSSWILFLYCDPDGKMPQLLPTMWLTWAFIAGRIIDAVADPLIGYWSDNTESRWGRRIPYMLFGSLPLCVVFFMLWAPPLNLFPTNSVALFTYLCVVMGAFWFLFTAVLCPYLALLPEIAVEEKDRFDLATYQSIFMLVSSGIVLFTAPLIIEKFGFPIMGLCFALFGMIGLYAPVVSIREKYKKKKDAKSYGFVTALKWSFSNKPFVIYLFSNVLGKIAFNAVIMGMPFIVTKILAKPISWQAIIMGGASVFAVVSFFIIKAMINTIDKKKVYLISMMMMAVLIPSTWLFGQYDVSISLSFIGLNAVIEELHVAIIVFTLAGFPIAGLMVLPPVMLSDVIDLDELRTGERREAMYFGAQGLIEKSGMALSGFIIGALMAKFGNSEVNHLGVDLIGPVVAGFVLIGFVIFMKYPITNEKSKEIREKIRDLHKDD